MKTHLMEMINLNTQMLKATVILLFSKDMSKEPAGILQCDTSGKYYQNYFNDWRHAIHYILWHSIAKKCKFEHEMFRKWSEIYGYHEYEEFTGDLNEFRTDDDSGIIFTSIGTITRNMDLNSLSAWTFENPGSDTESESESVSDPVSDEVSDTDLC